MAEVRLKNVYKIYAGDVTAVKDFSLDIRDGEFLVLVGPSGCKRFPGEPSVSVTGW